MQQYLKLLADIKKCGTRKPAARENMPGTTSLFGYQMRHDLADGFPLLTTKKMFWKGIVIELLWFLRGDTNIKYLLDNGVNIWNEDAYQYFCKRYPEIAPHKTIDQFLADVKEGVTLGSNYVFGDCGYQYGRVWRNFGGVDQIAEIIKGLRNNPQSRRHILTAIDPAHESDLALYWCHCMVQFSCRPLTIEEREEIMAKRGYGYPATATKEEQFTYFNIPKYYLDCLPFQRSADVVLGVPFNIASYGLLTHILAEMCNMVPGELIHTFGDVHIYDNHADAVEEQLGREPGKLPTLKLNEEIDWKAAIADFSNLTLSDFAIENYEPQSTIKAILSTGLKK